MKNTTDKKKMHRQSKPTRRQTTTKTSRYPSKETQWAYWMQAIEPTSEEIDKAFPGHHPQWVMQSQQIGISSDCFCYMRKHVLRINQAQCAAYLRVSIATLRRWEKGNIDVPFMAYELLRMVYRSVHFKLSHPEWDGWFISVSGKLVSPCIGDFAVTPAEINLVPFLHNWNATMKEEIAKLTRELTEARNENTALREIFLNNGITDEVASMQEKVNTLMSRINTARVIPFAPADIEQQPLEKVA